MADEEIFDKGEETPKPKRKLTQKQLDALARGRAKQAEKRRMKLDKEAMKETTQQRKEQRKVKKERKVEQEMLERIKVREKARKDEEKKKEKLSGWEKKRMEILEKCQSEKQFKIITDVLDSFEEEEILDESKMMQKFKLKHEELLKRAEEEK